MDGHCDFCGKKRETDGTTFVGGYCIECHQMVIEQSRNAILVIRERKKKPTAASTKRGW